MGKKVRNSFDTFDDEFEFFPLDDLDDGDLFGEVKDRKGIKYVKNALKSVKNLVVTIGEEAFPETSGVLKGFGEAGAEFKDTFTDYKDKAVDFINKHRGNGPKLSREVIGQEASNLFKSLKQDITDRFKTGYFIKSADDLFDLNSMMEDDEDDGSGGPSISAAPKSAMKDPNSPVQLRIRKEKKRYETTLKLENERAQSIKEATVGAAEAMVSSSVDLFEKTQMLEEARHHVHMQYLKNIATNIYKHTSMQAQLLQANIEYGKKSLAIYTEQLGHLKELREIQSIIYRKQEKSFNRKPNVRDIFGDGFDGSAYAQHVIGNIKNEFGLITGMLPMLGMMDMGMMGGKKKGGLESFLKMGLMAVNPINLIFNSLLSSKMKYGKDKIEKMFRSIPALINQKLVGKQYEGGWQGFLARILGVKDQETTVNVEKFSDMNLDAPTPFDVRTKRTINEVIPGILYQIAAGVTGREEVRYDFKKQTFKSVSAINKEYDYRQEMALNNDTEFSRYSNKISAYGNKAYEKKGITDISKIELQKGFDSIRKRIVNLQRGFDIKKAQNDQSYRKQLMRDIQVKDNDSEKKETILNLFLAGYSNLTTDERQFFKAAAVRVKGDIDSAANWGMEDMMNNYSGAGSAIASSSRDKIIKARESDYERIENEMKMRLRDFKGVGSKAAQEKNKKGIELSYKQRLREIRREIDSLKSGSQSIIGSNSVSIDNEVDYLQNDKFLSVPNMLKNITDILLRGIIVYPVGKIPEDVTKNIEQQTSFLSNQFKQNLKNLKDTENEVAESREQMLQETIADQEAVRKVTLGYDSKFANTILGKYANKGLGHLMNGMQEIASMLVGFDSQYDYNLTPEENAAKATAENADSKLKRKVENLKEHGNNIIAKMAGVVDNLISSADNGKFDFNSLASGSKENIKNVIDKTGEKVKDLASKMENTKAAQLVDEIKQKHGSEPIKAMMLEKVATNTILTGKTDTSPEGIDKSISELPSNQGSTIGLEAGSTFIDSNTDISENNLEKIKNDLQKQFEDRIEKIKNTTNNFVDQSSKVVNRSIKRVKNVKNKFNKTTNFNVDMVPTENKLDRIIEILEKSSGDNPESLKGPYDVTGIDEIIALLVSINAKDFSAKDISEIEKTIDKRNKKLKKPSLLGRIIKFPFRVAGHLAAGGGSLLGKLFGAAGAAGGGLARGIGGILPGLAGLAGGAAGGIANFFGKGIGGVLGGLGSGAKGLGKLAGGVVGGSLSAIGGIFRMGKSSVDKKLMKLSMSEGGLTLDRLLSEFDHDTLLKMNATIFSLKIDDKKLLKLSDKQLAKNLLKYWKNRGSTKGGIRDIAKGVGGIASGVGSAIGGFFKGAGQAASTLTGAIGNTLKGVGSAVFGKKHKFKNYEKGVLLNLVAIKSILEREYGPANMGKVHSEVSKYESGGIVGAAKSVVSAPVNFVRGLVSTVKSGIHAVKKRAGFVDRGDGSGIREGSYQDAKKDREEQEKKEREKQSVNYLEIIAENTSLLAKAEYKRKFNKDDNKDDEEEDDGLGLNIYDAFDTISDFLPGRNKKNRNRRNRRNRRNKTRNRTRNKTRNRTRNKRSSRRKPRIGRGGKLGRIGKVLGVAGIALAGVNLVQNISGVMSGQVTAGELVADTTESVIANANLSSVQQTVGIVGKFIAFFKTILGKFLSNPKVAKFVGKNFANSFLGTFTKGVSKFAAKISTRITSFMATATISAGTVQIAKAVIGFGWGMARASTYFPEGTKITLPMRITAGLVKALDFLAEGIPGLIFDFLGISLVEFIYNIIAKGISKLETSKWDAEKAKDIYGLQDKNALDTVIKNRSTPNLWALLKFNSSEIYETWLQRRFEPLYQMEQSLGTSQDIIDGTSTDNEAVDAFRKAFRSKAKDYISKEKIGKLTYKTTIKEFEKYFSATANINDKNTSTAKSTGETGSIEKTPFGSAVANKLKPFFSGALELTTEIGKVAKSRWEKTKDSAKEKFEMIKSKFGQITSFIGNSIKNVWNKGTEIVGNVWNGAKETVGGAIQKGKEILNNGGNVFQAVGGGIAAGASVAIGKLSSTIKKFTKRIKSSILGKEADTDSLHPEMKKRLAGLAQDYYNLTGKPLTINQAYRSMQDQALMKQKLGRRAASPSWRAPHTNGIAIDINTPDANLLESKGLLQKWGLWRPLWKPYNVSYPESWHVEIEGSRPILAGNRVGMPDAYLAKWGISPTNPYSPANFQEDSFISSPGATSGIKSGDPYTEKPGLSDEDLKADLKETRNNNLNTMNIEQTNGQTGTIPSVKNVSSVASQTTQTSVVSNAGVQGMPQTIQNVSELVKAINKVEENTRKTYETLAKHLPSLDQMVRLLAAILAVSQVNNGGGNNTNTADIMETLASTLAKG